MFDVGFSELILLIIVAIIVLGPNKASEAINYIIQARRKLSHFKSEFHQSSFDFLWSNFLLKILFKFKG